MDIFSLIVGGAIGLGLGGLERYRLTQKIRTLLRANPDTTEVAKSLPLPSLVRREMQYLQEQNHILEAENLDWKKALNLSSLGYLLIDQDNHLDWCNNAAQSLLKISDWQPGERRLFLEYIRSYELDQLVSEVRQQGQMVSQDWEFFPPLTLDASRELQTTSDAIPIKASGFLLSEGQVAIFIENQQLLTELRQGRDRAFSDLAHELRTPLTAIALITEEHLLEQVNTAQKTWVKRLLKEVNRLQNLVESWLYLTQITDNPNLYLELEPLNLYRLLEITWERLTAIAIKKQIQLDYQGSQNLALEGDGDRLMQVLTNLLDNALKHSPPEKTIFMTGQQQSEQVVLTIRDQGEGFIPKDLPYIFERLYRGDRSRTRQSQAPPRQGSGLGLAIAKKIVTGHGGQLFAKNDLEQGGAVFTLILPTVVSETK